MKKKGFTLIEMLGGIVVLAMITLIAVPVTVGIIEKARKSSLEDSGYGLVEAATLYYAEHQIGKVARFDIENNKVETKEEYPFRYKGSIQSGTVLINKKGEITICINDGKYAAYKNYKDRKVTIVDKKTCTVPENSSIVYLDGEATENSNNDLLKRIEALEQQNKNLQQQINNMNTSGNIANLTNQHNSDMNIIWNKVGREDLSSIGNGSISKILIDQNSTLNHLNNILTNQQNSITSLTGKTNTLQTSVDSHTTSINNLDSKTRAVLKYIIEVKKGVSLTAGKWTNVCFTRPNAPEGYEYLSQTYYSGSYAIAMVTSVVTGTQTCAFTYSEYASNVADLIVKWIYIKKDVTKN